jgi:hypothetical protein
MLKVAESRRLHISSWFSSVETIAITRVSRTNLLLLRTVFNSALTSLTSLVPSLCLISCCASSDVFQMRT